MVYSYGKSLEENKFQLVTLDYIYYLILTTPILLFSTILTDEVALLSALLGTFIYTWSRCNKNARVSYLFIPIKGELLPLASLSFSLLLNGFPGFWATLWGQIGGYVYNCLENGNLGPIYYYLYNKFYQSNSLNGNNTNINNNSNFRLNNVHTVNNTLSVNDNSYRDDGKITSPNWLIKLSNFMSISGNNFNNNNNNNFNNNVKNRFNRSGYRLGDLSNTSFSNSTSASTSSSINFKSRFSSNQLFKGKGHRLGD